MMAQSLTMPTAGWQEGVRVSPTVAVSPLQWRPPILTPGGGSVFKVPSTPFQTHRQENPRIARYPMGVQKVITV